MNYSGLRYLVEKYGPEGFALVGVPCNQFGGQAPGTDEEEREAAIAKFGIDFPVVDHVLVNGPDTHPAYRIMKAAQPVGVPASAPQATGYGREPGALLWNYTKFLIDRTGAPVKRFKPAFDPLGMEGDVRLALAGRPVLPGECIAHPGRKVCNVDRLLA